MTTCGYLHLDNINSTTQPPIRLYSENDCVGKRAELYPDANVPNLNAINSMGNEASSAVIPPNMILQGYWDSNYSGYTRSWDGRTQQLISFGQDRWNDEIMSAKATVSEPWSEWQYGCCTNRGDLDQNICGAFRHSTPPSDICSTIISDRCGVNADSLRTINDDGTENVQGVFCKSWCLENPGKCDPSAEAYCLNNKDDPFCACYTSELNDITLGTLDFPPSCYDNQCKLYGYKPAFAPLESEGDCPCLAIQDCRQFYTMDGSNQNVLKDVGLYQHCNQNIDITNTTNTDSSNPANTTDPSKSTQTNTTDLDKDVKDSSNPKSKIMLYLFLFILIVGIAIGIFTSLRGGVDTTPSTFNNAKITPGTTV